MNKKKGNVLIEFVLCVGLVSFLMVGTLQLTSLLVLQQKATSAARFGALLASSRLVEGEIVQREMDHYLKTFPSTNYHWTWEGGRFRALKSAGFYQLEQSLILGWPKNSRHPVIKKRVVVQESSLEVE